MKKKLLLAVISLVAIVGTVSGCTMTTKVEPSAEPTMDSIASAMPQATATADAGAK